MAKRRKAARLKARVRVRKVRRPKPIRKSIKTRVKSQIPKPFRPASWYRKLADDAARRQQRRYLQDTIKELRRIYTGFTPAKGYDARHPQGWSVQRRMQVQEYGGELHSYKAAAHIIVRPRTAEQRHALRAKTGQLTRRQKSYVVHVPAPDRSRIRFVRERAFVKGAPGMRVEIVEDVKGGEVFVREYLFREILGKQPETFKEMKRAMRRMMKLLPDQVEGEEAYYTIVSESHGPISIHSPKSGLLDTFQRWQEEYGNASYSRRHPGFAEQVIGVRLMGTRAEADAEYNRRQRERQDYQKMRAEVRRSRRRKQRDRGARLTGRRGRI